MRLIPWSLLLVVLLTPGVVLSDIYHCRIDGKDWFLNYPCPRTAKKLGVVMKTEASGMPALPGTPGGGSGVSGNSGGGGGGSTTSTNLTPAPLRSFGPAQAPAWTPPAPGSRRSGTERTEIDRIIQEASRIYNIPEAFIRGVIEVESGYNVRSLSYKGAMGLMQLMPSVCKDLGVTDPWDPYQNIMAGVQLLRILANRFNGDMPSVIAAYHAGGSSVATREGIPFQGTDGYVRKVLDHYYQLKYASQSADSAVR